MKLNKKDEYYLTMAQQGLHSFLILGVVCDGQPKSLVRVGKINDIDADASSAFLMTAKTITTGTLSRLADEGLYRKENHVVDIKYQAYTINFEQVKDFLQVIAEIDRKQFNDKVFMSRMKLKFGSHAIESQAIEGFVPTESEDDVVTFEFKKLKESNFLTEKAQCTRNPDVFAGIQQIHMNNTCRTTSKTLLEIILGFVTDISSHFFITPKYQTELKGGKPSKDTFYILPPPPNCANVSQEQAFVLKKIYKRLEKIPLLYPEAAETRKKFDALKSIYNNIAGVNQLTTVELLEKIAQYEKMNKQDLFVQRAPNFFSKLFSISSATQKMFHELSTDLHKMTPSNH